VSEGLAAVAELVRREAGITMTLSQELSLRAALGRAAPGLDPDAFLERTNDPLQGRDLVLRLIDEVTVKETTFLRDRDQLTVIDWHALHRSARAAGSDRIRVWSAGCATGEEPYTLALLATEAFAPLEPPVDVLGTDISGAALAAAGRGRYRERSVRELDPDRRRRYFEDEGGEFVAGERLRRYVRFSRHNLTRDPIPPFGEHAFDLIVCRNVLIYFDVPTVERILTSFERAVRVGGTLLIGAADALCGTATRLAASPAHHRRGLPKASRLLRRPHAKKSRPPDPEPPAAEDNRPRTDLLEAALAAADGGRSDEALAHADELLAVNPLDADAYFVRGLVLLEAGSPMDAVASLRRALYVDTSFALAAFTLGRAYDALTDSASARRSYAQALRTIEPTDNRHELLLQQVDLNDVAAACRARLALLR
jgi:chemotaxis protein methyltransferase CheR